jgi:DNA replication protein DnaC
MYSEEIMQQRKAEEEAFKHQQQRERIQQFMRECIPPLFRVAVDRDKLPDQHAFDAVMAWRPYTEGQPRNLIAYGPKGTGKTRAVYAAIRGLVENGIIEPYALCCHACDLAEAFRAAALGKVHPLFDRECASPRQARLLFIDDLGQTSLTNRLGEDFIGLFDYRYRQGLVTVFTAQTGGLALARRLSRGDPDLLPTVEAILRRLNQDGEATAVQFEGKL